MPGILWLASYPKSGNTWMRIFLANLILNPDEPLDINTVGEVCTSEANPIWFEAVLKRNGDDRKTDDLSNEEILDIRLEAQEYLARSNKVIVPTKTHNYFGEDDGKPLFNMNVTKAAIYIVRDPRDVAVSAQHHFGLDLDGSINLMADESARSKPENGMAYELYSSWSNHVESWTRHKHPGIIVLRYEDMIADPFKIFIPLAKKLGITQDEKRIRKAVEFSSFKVLQDLEKKKGFVEQSQHNSQFFRSGKSGDWRDKLNEKQRYRIEKAHKVQMKRFGYLK
ncbi:sulfotransferase domain-containing protein [Kiloniella sp. b19]|uniref:sulfotransferase domain-containing protein n=1 Tax=Kiloniella sp. GXU_MW_B19 TaxID=3141326 RepID=UPI0031D91330